MGVNVIIKQKKSLFKKKLEVEDINTLWKKSCINFFKNELDPRIGIMDKFNRIEPSFLSNDNKSISESNNLLKKSNEFILFNKLNYGSGIMLVLNENDIILNISFPTTYSEIVSFYNLIELICKKLNITKFYRDNQTGYNLEDIKDKEWFIELGINDTLSMLKKMESMTENESGFTINGVLNPISITIDNLKEFGIELPLVNNMNNIMNLMKNYENFMNEIQQRDLYYAVFDVIKITKEKPQVIAYIAIPSNCDTVLPLNPKSELYFIINKYDTSKINGFYACIENSQRETVFIEYEKFKEKIEIEKKEKYDGSHFIVRISDDFIKNVNTENGFKKLNEIINN